MDIFSDIDPDCNYFSDIFQDIGSDLHSKYETVETYSLKAQNSENFTCMSYNIRSFLANSDSFFSIFTDNGMPNILVITETWFNPSSTREIDGYKSFHVCRSDRRSGGVSIYVRNDIVSHKIVNCSYSNSTIEVCTICFYKDGIKYYLLGVYRPHSDTIDNFRAELDLILNNNLLKNSNCIAIGDFNIDLLHDSPAINNFSNSMYSNHFLPIITKPTRFSDHNQPSLLDHIWMKNIANFTCGILLHDMTDHLPIYVNLPTINRHSENHKVKISFRLINSHTKMLFKNSLIEYDWTSIESDNLHDYTSNFLDKLNEMFREACPLKVKQVPKKRLDNPWINSRVLKLIQAKSRYFQLYKLNVVTKAENNAFKNRIKKITGKVKQDYYKNLFFRNKQNAFKTWSVIHSLTGTAKKNNHPSRIISENIEIINNDEIAEIFNNYYTEMAHTLENNLPNSAIDPISYVTKNSSSSMHLYPISIHECIEVISNLKNTKVSLNSLPVFMLKENACVLAPIL